jgi:hypothetical protein
MAESIAAYSKAKHRPRDTAWLGRARVECFSIRRSAAPTAGQEGWAEDELIFIDQSVPGELRYDGAAAEDHHVFPGLTFHVLDLPRIEFVNDAGIFPRRVLEVLGENHFARLV